MKQSGGATNTLNERKPKPLPSQERLRELLSYDPDTGKLYWLPRENKQFTSHFAGKEALGRVSPRGYKEGKLDDRAYLTHRIIWKLVYGAEPEYIDHINGDPSDNRIRNLRSVSATENNRNKARNKNNSSGSCGVKWMGHSWQAGIQVDGRKHYLGRHPTKEEALEARRRAEIKFGFSERHGEAE